MSPAICAASLVAWRCAASYQAGIVITARVTGSPKKRSAVRRSSRRISAADLLGRDRAAGGELDPGVAVRRLGQLVRQHAREPADLGVIEAAAEQALGAEDREVGAVIEPVARAPRRRPGPSGENHTSDGSVVEPSSVVRMRGAPSRSITATTEFVVPRSMPTARRRVTHLNSLCSCVERRPAVLLACARASAAASMHCSWCASAVSSCDVASMSSPFCSAASAVAT